MKQTAPDWAAVIQQIVATGLTELEISKQPGVSLSLKAVRYLATGVQPLFHRGDALVRIWCERTGQARELIPTAPVLRGHRMARVAADLSPKMRNTQALMEAIKPPVQRQVVTPRRAAKPNTALPRPTGARKANVVGAQPDSGEDIVAIVRKGGKVSA